MSSFISAYCKLTLGPVIGLLWGRCLWILCCQTHQIPSSPNLICPPCGTSYRQPVLLDTLSIMATMVPRSCNMQAMQGRFG